MDPTSDPSKFKKNHLAAVTSLIPIQFMPTTRQREAFVLNVGYGGNEFLESSVRVILIDRHKVVADIYRHEMSEKLDTVLRINVHENILKVLLYFGYFVSERK